MENSDTNDTVPYDVTPEPVAEAPQPVKKKRSRLPIITLLGILFLIVVGAVSAYAGYAAGINQRKDAETALVTAKSQEQFDLAVQDLADGQYQRARQRLEYVAQLDPNFPGLTEQLALVLAQLNATATPTPAPTPTVAPTLDTSGVDGLFNQVQERMFNNDWSGAIDAMLQLRKDDPNYKTVQIDDLLFIALRNRGLEKISRQADLEGGLYDLSLAANFGPLDSEAQGYINWVSLYITGASFWELDWQKVVEYFSQVGPALPGLTDRSGMTARERYRLGLKGYGDTLMSAGDACGAAEQYQLSLSVGPDSEVEQLLSDAYTACQGGGEESSTEEQPAQPTPSEVGPPPVETIPPPVETIPPPEETPSSEPTVYPPPNP
jgi:tetratricopeptide (TPR) repeat protein